MDIDGATILVTGGCGLIGSATIELLLRDFSPTRIVILDNLSRGSLTNVEEVVKDHRVKLICGDIRDKQAVRAATWGVVPVIHMSALRFTALAADQHPEPDAR